jgi:hypothetical protein
MTPPQPKRIKKGEKIAIEFICVDDQDGEYQVVYPHSVLIGIKDETTGSLLKTMCAGLINFEGITGIINTKEEGAK